MAKSYRCELTTVAFAALLALAGTNAQALSLGRITVQSALGEPLRAEIDIPEITPDEAATLKAQVAAPEAFKSAGMNYSPVLPSLRMVLQKRPDGRAYLRVSGDSLVQEPFVDLILEASWSTGRMLRDYTLLFDPPDLRLPEQPITAPLMTPKVIRLPRSEPVPVAPVAPAAAVRQPTASAAAPAKSTSVPGGDKGRLVTVRAGETASKIAIAHKASNVSLNQMLVAMQQTNPRAFIKGNVNLIKAGAILRMPTAAQAQVIAPVQANQIITAQIQDFNRFRQTLASAAVVVKQAPVERAVSGAIQATVEDKKSATQTPDKLTLSKGAVQNASDLEQLAQTREAQASARRAAEISKNTEDLNQLAKTAALMAASGAASASVTEPTAPMRPASTPEIAVAAPEVQKPPAVATPVPPAATAEPTTGFLDELIANPLLPAGVAALIALLAGLAFYKARQRKKQDYEDSLFMESGLQAESFFGTSGGQSVNTDSSHAPGSPASYLPGQRKADADADPITEADVYLAYDRDMQAEEILKEALQAQPGRLALIQKLLAIYAKRQDAKAYAAMAALAYPLTQGTGPQWAQIRRTGLTLEPGNSLYLAESQPVSAPSAPALATDAASALPTLPENAPSDAPQPADDSVVDLDLDLDFSNDEPGPAPGSVAAVAVPSGMMAFDMGSLSLDLDDSSSGGNEVPPDANADPLESKLALAEEFKASGDDDGARDLIKQVIAEADGAIKAKAQQALSQL
ncbi:MAG: fimbrial protein FimV [Rhodoferax sp.]|nr:fimbrial protein FimV [Rhodoferax sp.]